MHKPHVVHLSAILAAGAISLALLASTTSAFAASPRITVPIGTTTSLGLSLTSVAYGSETSEIFRVSVTGLSGDGYPEGTVAVYNSSTELCSATLVPITSDSASATCALTAFELVTGAYDDVFATYAPGIPSSSDTSYTYTTSNSSPVQAFSVGSASKYSTLTKVSKSPSIVTYGNESVTLFSVRVTSESGQAVLNGEKATVNAGPVTCIVVLTGTRGTCRIANTALPVGSYAASATYGGDANLSGSSGLTADKLVVSKDTTRISVSESPNRVTYGNESASVFFVTVTTHFGEAVPNGEKVSVSVGSVTRTVVLKGGKGTCTIANTDLQVGLYPVSATYGGDANLSGSSLSELTV